MDQDAPEIDYSDSLDYALEPITFRLTSTKLDSETKIPAIKNNILY